MMRMCCTAAIIALHSAALGQTAEFTPLGDLPGGVYFSTASDVSADGRFVAGAGSSDLGFYGEAVRWDLHEGIMGLGVLPGHNQSQAGGISPDGSWVVGRSVFSPDQVEAMAWSSATGMMGLGDLPGGGIDSIAYAVSRRGAVIVGRGSTETGGEEHGEAFMWTQAGGMQGLGDLQGGDRSSSARDISSNGRVIVGSSASYNGVEAFRWTPDGGMVGLGAIDPDHFSSGARAVSNNGSWIVGESRTAVDDGGGSSTANQAVLWTPGGDIIGLGWLHDSGARYSFAFDVTNDGSMVVGRSSGGTGARDAAYVWTASDGMRALSEILLTDYGLDVEGLGWILDTATSISPDGTTIVGSGINPEGRSEAWMVKLPVPTPSTLGIVLPFSCLAMRRRR